MTSYTNLREAVLSATEQYPNQLAIQSSQLEITYQELARLAQHWALTIRINLAKRPSRIAILTQRTPSAYISLLATLYAGATFIPLNSRNPIERNLKIMQLCQPDAIIIDESALAILPALRTLASTEAIFTINQPKLELTSLISSATTDSPTDFQLPAIEPSDIAYILFTSGSTGAPKGVPISHANVCAFIHYAQSQYHINTSDKLSQSFELTFDLAMFDLFMAWCHGATICPMQAIDLLAPNQYLISNQLTVWFSVPTVISRMAKQGFLIDGSFPSLRLSLFCGEPLLEEMLEAWSQAAPNSICENLYGPTELTIACAQYRFKRGQANESHNQVLSIGTIYPHLDYLISDDSKIITGTETGELCVTGPQRFHGYLNALDDQSAFFHYQDKKFYRTGDFVKRTPTGNLLYMGRRDQQIKINGFRVELGEIETIINTLNGIERAVVICLEQEGLQELAAFVVGKLSIKEIQASISQRLPSYMLPKKFLLADQLPLNANGKIDRQKIKQAFMY